MAIAQNGPGITNFVTPMKTAYWNHTPLLLVTPQAANRTIGQGGFQEVEQMALFRDMVAYQEEVRDPLRIAEVLNRVIEQARRRSAPAQINVPRDFWTQVIDIELPQVIRIERPRGGAEAIAEAAKLLAAARFPVILNGAGVVLAGAIPASAALAERLGAPVACGYQHNDAFPGSHPLSVGPLGYNGSKAAMELIAKADVVLALGTRLNPFSTLPGYGIDYWPKNAKVIQVDINPDRIGLTKPVTWRSQGTRSWSPSSCWRRCRSGPADPERAALVASDPVGLAAGADVDGPRGGRSGHDLERAGAGGEPGADEPADGVAGDQGGAAEGGDHLVGHRQQLRDRQRLPELRGGAQVPGAGAVRSLRLRLSGDPRGEDRAARTCRWSASPATGRSGSR